MPTDNPFAFVLQKPRAALDRPFYAAAKRFQDIDDEMWLYLLDLIPGGHETYERRTTRMLGTLSVQLQNYFLVRSFDSECGSGGMESVLLEPDAHIQLQPTTLAFQALGAVMHVDLIERAAALARLSPKAGVEAELDEIHERLQPFNREWQKLARREDFYATIFSDIRRDASPYLHPPEPQPTAAGNRGERPRSKPGRSARGA